jgi:hypothetical protein
MSLSMPSCVVVVVEVETDGGDDDGVVELRDE